MVNGVAKNHDSSGDCMRIPTGNNVTGEGKERTDGEDDVGSRLVLPETEGITFHFALAVDVSGIDLERVVEVNLYGGGRGTGEN